ncbi:MAG: hypothetical protein IJ227_02770 [Mogibacterium sp.]|nr:hypothetical protein [Mogibacterium sp.]
MKKKLALLLSLAMVLTFALSACGEGSESADQDLSDSKYVGTWVSDSMSFAGEEGDMQSVFTLTLNGDGTGTLTGEEADGTEDVSSITWSLTDEGFKTEGDAKMDFKDDGDAIVTKLLGVEMRLVREGEGETADAAEGNTYGYTGTDPVEAACYQYMVETVAKDFEPADVSIPTVNIIAKDDSAEDEVLVYGDFWVENYNIDGDTLKCVSGGNFPGCMHVSKADNTVTAFDQVADGSNFEPSAKEIFGDNYDAFMKVYSDSDARTELRSKTVSDYVKQNGLDVNYYQDEGWDPVEISK